LEPPQPFGCGCGGAKPRSRSQAQSLYELRLVDAPSRPRDEQQLLTTLLEESIQCAMAGILQTSFDRREHRLGDGRATRQLALTQP